MIITAFYKNGINSDKDKAALAIAKKFKAQLQGSGCCLFEPFERDFSWKANDKTAPEMVKALKRAGFKVQS